jgi:hypothetical protein
VCCATADPAEAVHQATREYVAHIRGFVEQLATEAGVPDPHTFAQQWHILMKGSIVAAAEGDPEAAMRAQEIGRLFLTEQAARPRKSRARDTR